MSSMPYNDKLIALVEDSTIIPPWTKVHIIHGMMLEHVKWTGAVTEEVLNALASNCVKINIKGEEYVFILSHLPPIARELFWRLYHCLNVRDGYAMLRRICPGEWDDSMLSETIIRQKIKRFADMFSMPSTDNTVVFFQRMKKHTANTYIVYIYDVQ